MGGESTWRLFTISWDCINVMTLRTRISSFYTILLMGGVILVSAVSSWQITNYLDESNARQLSDQTDLFTRLIETGAMKVNGTPEDDAVLRNAAHSLRVRLTALDESARVVFDSSMPADSLVHVENHGQRPEILAARHGGVGLASRKSATTGEEYLYAARMIDRPGDSVLHGGFVRVAAGLGEIRAMASRVRTTIWVIGVLAILVILVVSVQVARRVTRPILAIAATADAIRDGDLKQRVTVATNDEISSLATAINEMAERLGSDIERLTKLEKVRSQFLGNVSHELRTPIFAIQGFLETLLDGAVDDPSVNREFLEKAHNHAMRLNTLLSDLIEISSIESGEMKMSFRYFGLQEFLDQMHDELRPLTQKQNLTFAVESSMPGDARIFGDRDRLHQAIANLVNNAVKYTGRGGSVILRAVPEGGQCRIEVQDSGCGIAPEHHSRIFERFYRVDKDRSREVGGTGLGLAIVKHIVEAHGGTIGVRSALGAGSTFFFTIKQ
jgi:two-component system, OmpR family, phosphate regulon sensor histidine kinase PhoR